MAKNKTIKIAAVERDLYPIYYKGKKYTAKTVSPAFFCNYHSKLSLNANCAVYCFNDIWVTPDGEFQEF